MEIKHTFIKELSQKIKVIQMTRNEIRKELAALNSDISSLSYKSWVLENFIPAVNYLFSYIIDRSEDPEHVQELKTVVYDRVIRINPLLDPSNLYVDTANSVTLTKGKHSLVSCDTWEESSEESNLIVLELHEFFEMSEQARGYDHNLEAEDWDLVDMQIKVRVFAKSLKSSLVFGIDPKTEDDIKYFVVATCIDSFHQIYKYLSQNPDYNHLSLGRIVDSLYAIAIEHNPFLELTLKDVKKINRNTHQVRYGNKEEIEEPGVKVKGRASLAKVPKKEIVELETAVRTKIFGQEEAIVATCNAVKRAYLGLKLKNKPIGSFLFYGPTSTGKTELAKVLAELLIKDADAGMVNIPCGSTLQDKSGLNTLIGAPPSYVGYEEGGGGVLPAKLKKGKFKIILFDEVDKATPKVFDLVLEMLDEGRIMAADGTTLDVQECLIIFTSNIGQEEAAKAAKAAGFESESSIAEKASTTKAEYKKAVEKKLPPEFLARLSGTYFFRSLNDSELIKTANLHLNKYAKDWKRKLNFEVTDERIGELIVSKCKRKHKKKFHARDLKDFIDVEIVQKLGDYIINSNIDLRKIEKITLGVDNAEEFVFDIKTKGRKLATKTKKATR
jgi:ATP-dependent Clp protease ATP-binding subunit ClpA